MGFICLLICGVVAVGVGLPFSAMSVVLRGGKKPKALLPEARVILKP